MIIRSLLGFIVGGLDEAWATRIIEQVGNYGEIFERGHSRSETTEKWGGPECEPSVFKGG